VRGNSIRRRLRIKYPSSSKRNNILRENGACPIDDVGKAGVAGKGYCAALHTRSKAEVGEEETREIPTTRTHRDLGKLPVGQSQKRDVRKWHSKSHSEIAFAEA